MNKKINSWFLTFILLIITISFFGFFIYLGFKEVSDKNESISKHKGISTAIIIRTGNMKGSYVIAEFYYKDKRIEFKDNPPAGYSLTGLSFPVNFDTLNPETAKLIFEEPFFQKKDDTAETQGEITRINDDDIEFEYFVDNEKYNQFQQYNKKSKVEKDVKYSVLYLKDNPQVSLIKINGNNSK